MPIGPLAIAIVRGILPYYTTDSNTVMAAKVAAHQGAETAVIWLTFVAMLTLVPGVIALGMLARRHAPRLGTTGLVLACAGFLSLFWSTVAGSDNVALAAAHLGMRPTATGALVTSMGNIVPIGLASNIFVLGHVLGLVLLGIALWRGRVVPAWAGAAARGLADPARRVRGHRAGPRARRPRLGPDRGRLSPPRRWHSPREQH